MNIGIIKNTSSNDLVVEGVNFPPRLQVNTRDIRDNYQVVLDGLLPYIHRGVIEAKDTKGNKVEGDALIALVKSEIESTVDTSGKILDSDARDNLLHNGLYNQKGFEDEILNIKNLANSESPTTLTGNNLTLHRDFVRVNPNGYIKVADHTSLKGNFTIKLTFRCLELDQSSIRVLIGITKRKYRTGFKLKALTGSGLYMWDDTNVTGENLPLGVAHADIINSDIHELIIDRTDGVITAKLDGVTSTATITTMTDDIELQTLFGTPDEPSNTNYEVYGLEVISNGNTLMDLRDLVKTDRSPDSINTVAFKGLKELLPTNYTALPNTGLISKDYRLLFENVIDDKETVLLSGENFVLTLKLDVMSIYVTTDSVNYTKHSLGKKIEGELTLLDIYHVPGFIHFRVNDIPESIDTGSIALPTVNAVGYNTSSMVSELRGYKGLIRNCGLNLDDSYRIITPDTFAGYQLATDNTLSITFVTDTRVLGARTLLRMGSSLVLLDGDYLVIRKGDIITNVSVGATDNVLKITFDGGATTFAIGSAAITLNDTDGYIEDIGDVHGLIVTGVVDENSVLFTSEPLGIRNVDDVKNDGVTIDYLFNHTVEFYIGCEFKGESKENLESLIYGGDYGHDLYVRLNSSTTIRVFYKGTAYVFSGAPDLLSGTWHKVEVFSEGGYIVCKCDGAYLTGNSPIEITADREMYFNLLGHPVITARASNLQIRNFELINNGGKFTGDRVLYLTLTDYGELGYYKKPFQPKIIDANTNMLTQKFVYHDGAANLFTADQNGKNVYLADEFKGLYATDGKKLRLAGTPDTVALLSTVDDDSGYTKALFVVELIEGRLDDIEVNFSGSTNKPWYPLLDKDGGVVKDTYYTVGDRGTSEYHRIKTLKDVTFKVIEITPAPITYTSIPAVVKDSNKTLMQDIDLVNNVYTHEAVRVKRGSSYKLIVSSDSVKGVLKGKLCFSSNLNKTQDFIAEHNLPFSDVTGSDLTSHFKLEPSSEGWLLEFDSEVDGHVSVGLFNDNPDVDIVIKNTTLVEVPKVLDKQDIIEEFITADDDRYFIDGVNSLCEFTSLVHLTSDFRIRLKLKPTNSIPESFIIIGNKDDSSSILVYDGQGGLRLRSKTSEIVDLPTNGILLVDAYLEITKIDNVVSIHLNDTYLGSAEVADTNYQFNTLGRYSGSPYMKGYYESAEIWDENGKLVDVELKNPISLGEELLFENKVAKTTFRLNGTHSWTTSNIPLPMSRDWSFEAKFKLDAGTTSQYLCYGNGNVLLSNDGVVTVLDNTGNTFTLNGPGLSSNEVTYAISYNATSEVMGLYVNDLLMDSVSASTFTGITVQELFGNGTTMVLNGFVSNVNIEAYTKESFNFNCYSATTLVNSDDVKHLTLANVTGDQLSGITGDGIRLSVGTNEVTSIVTAAPYLNNDYYRVEVELNSGDLSNVVIGHDEVSSSSWAPVIDTDGNTVPNKHYCLYKHNGSTLRFATKGIADTVLIDNINIGKVTSFASASGLHDVDYKWGFDKPALLCTGLERRKDSPLGTMVEVLLRTKGVL